MKVTPFYRCCKEDGKSIQHRTTNGPKMRENLVENEISNKHKTKHTFCRKMPHFVLGPKLKTNRYKVAIENRSKFGRKPDPEPAEPGG